MTDSLLQCTLKKSQSVAKGGVIGISKVIVFMTVVSITYFFGITVLLPLFTTGIDLIVCPAVEAILALVLAIPWYAYPIVAIPIVVLGYSFLWCVARDLTEEDWKSEIAEGFVLLLSTMVWIMLWFLVGGMMGMVLLALVMLVMSLPVMLVLSDVKIFRFPGALYHHWKVNRK